MTSVVGRLRSFVQQGAAGTGQTADLKEEMRPDRILH